MSNPSPRSGPGSARRHAGRHAVLGDGTASRCHWDETAMIGPTRVALLGDQETGRSSESSRSSVHRNRGRHSQGHRHQLFPPRSRAKLNDRSPRLLRGRSSTRSQASSRKPNLIDAVADRRGTWTSVLHQATRSSRPAGDTSRGPRGGLLNSTGCKFWVVAIEAAPAFPGRHGVGAAGSRCVAKAMPERVRTDVHASPAVRGVRLDDPPDATRDIGSARARPKTVTVPGCRAHQRSAVAGQIVHDRRAGA